MSTYTTSYDSKTLETNTDNNNGRAWVTETGRGEVCRTCQTQINVRNVPGDDGRCTTLCADCRAIFGSGGAHE